jgi:hypothetical protein
MDALGTAAGGGFGRRQQGRKAERERSIQPVVVERGKDIGGFVMKKHGRTQRRDRWKATRAGGERRGWTSLEWVNPLRDRWGGASPGRQELPWTRKERKGRRGEEKKERCDEKVLFCGRKDVPA